MSDKMKNLVVRTITGILFVAVMVTSFMESFSMVALFALITGLTVWEYTGLVNRIEGVMVNRLLSVSAAVCLFLAVACFASGYLPIFVVFVPFLLTIVYLFVSMLYFEHVNAISSWAYTMLGQMYIALPLSMINVLAFCPDDKGSIVFFPLLPLSVFVFLWINDTGAYCSGSLFGRHKLFPRISPGKTWEGSIGGGVLVLIVAAFVGCWSEKLFGSSVISVIEWIGLGLVIVVFGTLGDLVESLFKRTLGVKDSGNILPGHGGMLDRFDSSLMALPAAVIYLYSIVLF